MKIWMRKDLEQTIVRSIPSIQYMEKEYYEAVKPLYGQLLNVNTDCLFKDAFYLEGSKLKIFQWMIDDVIDDKRTNMYVCSQCDKTAILTKDYTGWKACSKVYPEDNDCRGTMCSLASDYTRYNTRSKSELFNPAGKVMSWSNAKNGFREWIRDMTPIRAYVYRRLDDSTRLTVLFKNFCDKELIGETNFEDYGTCVNWLSRIKDKRMKQIPIILESTAKRLIHRAAVDLKMLDLGGTINEDC